MTVFCHCTPPPTIGLMFVKTLIKDVRNSGERKKRERERESIVRGRQRFYILSVIRSNMQSCPWAGLPLSSLFLASEPGSVL